MNSCNTEMLFFLFSLSFRVNQWPRWGNQLSPAPVWPLNRGIKETHSYLLYLLQLVGLIHTVNDVTSPPLWGFCAFLSAAVWKLCPYLPAVCGTFYLRLYRLFTVVLLFFIRCLHHVFTTGNSWRFTGGKQWAKREGLNRTLLNF